MTEDHYKRPYRHKLISIEGIDASGKTEQARLLHMKLVTSIGGIVWAFPNYNNKTGKFIASLLENGNLSYHSHAWATLLATNRYEDKEFFEICLRHTNIITNRYWPSNLVYSTASGIDTQWLAALDSQMPKPDLVIVLDVSPEVSIKRKKDRDVIERDSIYLTKVQNLYISLGATMGWHVIDGVQSIAKVHQEILKIVNHEFNWNL